MGIIQNRLKTYRKSNGWTQAQFATELGVTQQTYQEWESGKIEDLRSSTIIRICETFKISANWLLGIDREEDTTAEMAKYVQMRNAFYRAVKALEKEGIADDERQKIIEQLQSLIDQLK